MEILKGLFVLVALVGSDALNAKGELLFYATTRYLEKRQGKPVIVIYAADAHISMKEKTFVLLIQN